MKKILSVIGLGLLLGLMLIPQPAMAVDTPVGLELSLLVDVSGSIDATEFALQKTGYVNAFNSAAVQNAIMNGVGGGIAVNLVYWSGTTDQQQAVGWTLINSVASAQAFAAAINATTRPFSANTALQSALQVGTGFFTNNGFVAPRQVIDISGDGARNEGLANALGRDFALANDIDTINGLVILGETGLQTYYQDNVIGGTSPFLAVANDFGDFGAAIQEKIVKEVVGVPEPGTLILLGCALAGLYGIRRKVS